MARFEDLSPEQKRIFRAKHPVLQDSSDASGDTAPAQFYNDTKGVYPYTRGFLDEQDGEDFKTSITKELDSISASTQYLFDAYNNAVEAAGDAKEAYDAAVAAQTSANDAMNQAIEANTKAIQNAQDIVTLQGTVNEQGDIINEQGETIGNIQVTVGDLTGQVSDLSGEVAGIQTTISNQGAEITQIQAVTDDYTAQWGVKTNINGIINGVGLVANGSGAAFVVDADAMIFTDGSAQVTPFAVKSSKVYMSDVVMQGSDSGGSIEITNTQIIVKDGSGKNKVIIGKIS